MTTLLLTWTIKPNNDRKHISTVLSDKNFFDPEYRLKDYISTILYYITQSDFDNIVFCENSNYEIKNIGDIQNTAKLFNKKFELLQFEWDSEKVLQYSYHYWEAEIFDYAFENSILLSQSKSFFKSTWRYIVYNINQLIADYKDRDYFFYKWFWFTSILSINTAFFMVSSDFYRKYLYKKQLAYYSKNHTSQSKFIPLEGVFYQLLKKTLFKDNFKIISFPIFHFFSFQTILWEIFKKHIWLLGFWFISKIIELILPKLKKVLK